MGRTNAGCTATAAHTASRRAGRHVPSRCGATECASNRHSGAGDAGVCSAGWGTVAGHAAAGCTASRPTAARRATSQTGEQRIAAPPPLVAAGVQTGWRPMLRQHQRRGGGRATAGAQPVIAGGDRRQQRAAERVAGAGRVHHRGGVGRDVPVFVRRSREQCAHLPEPQRHAADTGRQQAGGDLLRLREPRLGRLPFGCPPLRRRPCRRPHPERHPDPQRRAQAASLGKVEGDQIHIGQPGGYHRPLCRVGRRRVQFPRAPPLRWRRAEPLPRARTRRRDRGRCSSRARPGSRWAGGRCAGSCG